MATSSFSASILRGMKVLRDRAIHYRRWMRAVLPAIPASLLIVVGLASVAIAAEVTLAKTPARGEVELVYQAQAKRGRTAGFFDMERGTAMAVSPMAVGGDEDADTALIASRPLTCWLTSSAGSLKCQ